MGKQPQQGGSKGKVKVGKGKVTALQVAFMVERYLAENNYTNALAAFRSDAADLFVKMSRSPSAAAASGKSMKGLMGLGEILDEYIGLKEQKLLLQRDRSRLDSAMHAFHTLFRSYFDGSSSDDVRSAASPDSSPPVPPQIFSSTPADISTPSTSNPIPITAAATAARDGKKRKASTSYALPASKTTKPHSHGTTVPSSSLIPSTSKSVPVPGDMQSKVQLVNQSIAKSLFRPGQPVVSIASPQTPQPNPSSTKPTPTCSIVSSERSIIVSPLKCGSSATYYTVERTCQFTSPLKTDARTSGKIREHVKGKLNFDSADANVNVASTEIAVAPSDDKVSPSPSTSSPSSSSDGGENQNQVLDGFDFDFSDFDILSGDFSFSELLVDLDLDHDGFHSHSQSSPEQTDPSPRLQSEVEGGEAAQIISPDTSKLSVHDSPDASFPGGHESVTSFRAITKRVKIMSPVKIMRKQ